MSLASSPVQRRRMAYLCLQATRVGQGSHAHVLEIIKGLRRRDWDVDLFQPAYAGEMQQVGIARRLVAFISVQLRFVSGVGRYSVVYVRDHPAVLPAVAAARLAGRVVILELNGPPDELVVSFPSLRWCAGLLRSLGRLRWRLASGVITNTEWLASSVRARVGGPVRAIPNGADPERFVPAPQYGMARPYVVFVGVLAPWQGLDILLAAAQHPDWPNGTVLKIAGDGAMRAQVQVAAGQVSHIEYLGVIPYSEVPGLIAGSRAAVSPKNVPEGLMAAPGLSPLKMYEGMSCGVPIIATDVRGQADVVRGASCGMVVPPGDPGSLARAVAHVVLNPVDSATMGRSGRRAVVESFSWDARAGETDDFIREVCVHARS